MNKNYWSMLLAAGLLAFTGCNEVVESPSVTINPAASMEELTKQASEADKDTLKQIIAAYDEAIIQTQKDITKQTNEIGKYKVVELNSDAAKQDIDLLDNYKAKAEKLAKDKAIFTDAMTNKQQNDLTRKFVHHSFCSTDGVIFLYPININNLINYQ